MKLSAFHKAQGDEVEWYSPYKVVVYILTNFGTTFEQDMHRIQFCRSINVQPYVMIYDKAHAPKIYRELQRWCNPFIFWGCKDFKSYKG